MTKNQSTRRRFLQGTAAAAVTPYIFTGSAAPAQEEKSKSKNDRPVMGCIGTGSRWGQVGKNAMAFADCVAVCDVDKNHTARAQKAVMNRQGKEPKAYDDYQKLLERKDIDVITIVTPDHWHTKIAIDAMRAGKDVYCEKPLTLTVDEGKQIIKVLKETKRVFQVGTQQRSEMGLRFLKAVAIAKAGRLGKIKRVECSIGGAPKSGPLKKEQAPSHLDWEKWLGQAPLVDYIKRRCHYEFRWWYEYSGGKMTDWGAHHVDIAQWAIGMDHTGPTSVKGVMAKHPVPYKAGYPTKDNEYNTAHEFQVQCMFPNGVEMVIRHDKRNGIVIDGEDGIIYVGRRKLEGTPVTELKDDPLPEDALKKLYKGKTPGGGNAHMRNFFECLRTREQPISDVYTHHRAVTTCHLANIAIRLNRELKWDAKKEQIVGDDEANKWLKRKQRKGYEIKA